MKLVYHNRTSQRYKEKLPNAEMVPIAYKRFSHIDFVTSNFTKELVYDDVIERLERV